MAKFYLILIFTSLLFHSCKTASKAYEKGDYSTALDLAIKKLQSDPNDADAKQLVQLAYSNKVQIHEDKIRSLSNSSSDRKWGEIYNEYVTLQRLYEQVRPYPAIAALVGAKDYSEYKTTYREKAGDVYFQRGLEWAKQDNKMAYREAYNAFSLALKYKPDDIEIKTQTQLAYEKSLVNVLVVPLNQYMGGFGSFFYHQNDWQFRNFQNDLVRNLTNQVNNRFIRFVNEWDLRSSRQTEVDEIVEFQLGNFQMGIPIDQNRTRTVTKEVVVREIVHKPDSITKQYATVRANIVTTRRTLVSVGNLNVIVRDGNGRFLFNDIVSAENRWHTEFAYYTGDERALSENDRRIINQQQHNVPRQEQVMEDLLMQLRQEASFRIRNYYSQYR